MLYSIKKIQNKNPGEKPGFYFIAKKKIFKRAVDRNKAKRIARHAFRKVWTPDIQPKSSIVFFLERDMIHTSFEDIVFSFKKDLSNLK